LIKADSGQLQQVLLNLAVNARDAMPNGGVITFQTSNISLATDDLYHTNELSAGDYVKLTVSDTGIGMGEDVKKHIFEPFFTTKEKGKGTGLGLATCYGIIKQCAGHIVVESQQGQGTTFQIYLPRADSSSSVLREDEPAPALPLGKESILIVEDEMAVRNLSAHILESLGYVVLEAKDGDSARTILMERAGNVDLMFVDVVLPDVGGNELAAWAERLYPGSRVLFTSGYMEEALFKHYGLNADSAFLQKPFTPADLAWKVRKMIDGTPGRRAKSARSMNGPEKFV
jgi:two-component system cell cycle sensor histidine kinase/response regulator CckA